MEQEYEEEIDLMDYLKVIIKRKKLILTVFSAAIIAAGVFSFLSPKVYKVDTVLEIGQVAGTEIEAPGQIVEKIGGDVYGILIREKLELTGEEYPKIKAENPKDTKLLIIMAESNNPQKAREILSETIDLILKEHGEKFIEKNSLLEEEIAKTEKELEFLKSYKAYADWGIAQLQTELSDKKRQLAYFEMTEIIKPPAVSEKPIKPKPFLNMVIAVILGLFIGTFLAFFQEWWEKNQIKL